MNNDMDYYYKKPEEISNKLLALNGLFTALIVLMIFVISDEVNKNKQVDFYNFNITNTATNELIRTGWTEDVIPKQILRVPVLYIDGDTYIENTKFGTIESTPAGLNATGIIVTPVGEAATTNFKV